MMKSLTLFLFFLSTHLFAQSSEQVQINMGVDGKRIDIKCEQTNANSKMGNYHFDIYYCEKNGKKYYVKKMIEFDHWNALEFDGSSFKNAWINEISNKKEMIYKSVVMGSGDDELASDDLIHDYNKLLNLKNSHYELFSADTIASSFEVKKMQREMQKAYFDELSKIEKLVSDHREVIVTTEDNQKLKCQRPKGEKCLHYLCAPITRNGQEFQVSLRGLNLSNGESPYLVSVGGQSLGPDLLIKEINLGEKRLYENNYFPKKNETSFMPEKFQDSERTYSILTDQLTSVFRKNELKECQDKALSDFENKLQDKVSEMSAKLEEVKLIQLIQTVDGILESKTILAHEISNKMCHMGGDVYYFDKDHYNAEIEKSFQGFSPSAAVVPKARLSEIYDFSIAQTDIPYAYYQDGCYARAHTLCDRIEKELGVDTEKIWARGPVAPPNDDTMSWSYHVATKLNVEEEDGRIQGYVIDPSVAKRPLLESEWLELISINKKTAIMKTTWPPFNNTGSIRNIQVSYSPNEVYAFFQKAEKLTPQMIEANNKKALQEIEMYRSYLDEK